jgi:hypothetical protein
VRIVPSILAAVFTAVALFMMFHELAAAFFELFVEEGVY